MTDTAADAVGRELPLGVRELAELPVTRLRGVGPKKADGLAQLGITSVLDLLTHYPRRYVDRTREALLAELRPGEEATVVVRVSQASTRRTKRGQAMTTVRCVDGAGTSLGLTFFNQAWRERQLQPGALVVVYGRLELFRGARQMTSPLVDLIGDRTGRIVPIYPQSEKAGLSTWEIGDLVEEALRRATARRGIADPLPVPWRDRLDLVDRGFALRTIHAPESMKAMMAARKRLVFDELLRVQLALVQRKRQLEHAARGISHTVQGPLVERFLEALPFPLTGAQRRVIDEIATDLVRPLPMHRLLQGDVGAGKTVVAVATLLMAVQGGHQGALMAPTEVLAEQHGAGVRRLLAGLEVPDPASLLGDRPIRVELLTNRTTAAERRRILAGLADGGVDIAVGTHALIQDAVQFARLGAVVIDEQHRFGVEQRAALRDRGGDGATPDVLVMTATPIPRTAAMTVYGDLDVSVLDELPPGRTPIDTIWAADGVDEAEAWAAVRAQVAEGRQAYVVTPLVEDSEKLEASSAEATYARLGEEELAGLRLGLLHGRVPPADKDAVMERFRRGELDVLVATTVIEVGVDVPNATVMVILDADRFGIAQLHQLRGRVGRGVHRSTCYLVAHIDPEDQAAQVAAERLAAMVRTTDGFELAEVDLELRGEGTIMGERQKGRNDLKLASLRRDKELVMVAREVALHLVDERGTLAAVPELDDEVRTMLGEADTEFLLKS
ncbi:MAG: ATP-dependent DNA helicase RecG [Acidimicrobiales bacterium]